MIDRNGSSLQYPNCPSPKMEIIAVLAARYGFRRYLELCSSTSGHFYGKVDRKILTTAHRLMYNCPPDFDDGLGIDFRSESFDISQCVAAINRNRFGYDIILVDPWHEYRTSIRDLRLAFDLIAEGGVLVVHDCLPPNHKVAAPEFVPGAWCGVTYKAYLDFVGGRRDLEYCTVDVIYGCGIVRKLNRPWWMRLNPKSTLRRAEHRQPLLWKQWHEIGNDFDRAYRFFEEHKKELLNLMTADEFLATL